jgi:hypothetical protein
MFHAAVGRTLLLTLLGHRRYEELSRWRGARSRDDAAPTSLPAPQA